MGNRRRENNRISSFEKRLFLISFTDEDRRFFISEKKEGDTLGIYSQIKEQVSTREAAEHYGYKVSRNGMMCCPFHNDRTPSMKVDWNFICSASDEAASEAGNGSASDEAASEAGNGSVLKTLAASL